MPRGNKTGPNGMGPMTGRGRGICAGSDTPGCVNDDTAPRGGRGRRLGNGQGQGRGRGLGLGRGRGRGFGPAPVEPPLPMHTGELHALTEQVAVLRGQIAALAAQLAAAAGREP